MSILAILAVDQVLNLVESVTAALVQRKRQKALEAWVADHPESYVIPRSAARVHLTPEEAIAAEDGDAAVVAMGERRFQDLSGKFPDAWRQMVG